MNPPIAQSVTINGTLVRMNSRTGAKGIHYTIHVTDHNGRILAASGYDYDAIQRSFDNQVSLLQQTGE